MLPKVQLWAQAKLLQTNPSLQTIARERVKNTEIDSYSRLAASSGSLAARSRNPRQQ